MNKKVYVGALQKEHADVFVDPCDAVVPYVENAVGCAKHSGCAKVQVLLVVGHDLFLACV